MDTDLINKIHKWHAADNHQQIVDEIQKVPEAERSYELINLLARAYNNLEEYETALKLLESIKEGGRDDALWHFRRGYACYMMGYDEEAGRELSKSLELNPEDKDAESLLQVCLTRLGYYDDSPVEDPQQQVLIDFHNYIQEHNLIEDGSILIPEWDMHITPHVEELQDDIAIINTNVECPSWDRTFFECSAGMGATQKTALTAAEGLFIFAALSGIRSMMNDTTPKKIVSSYDSREHRWRLYKSDVVGTGETPESSDVSEFWNVLQNGIINRLGNQKMVYVKVYAAKHGDDIIGECRINDIFSNELSALVIQMVKGWNTEKFGSKKQFFFLRQDDETYEEYAHSEQDLEDATAEAIRLFEKCSTQEDYDNFVDNLTAKIGDRCLAEELYMFLPEMCAEVYFQNLNYAETLFIHQGKETEVYKSQMASYYSILRTLCSMLNAESFSKDAFAACVCGSTIYTLVKEAEKNGEDLGHSKVPIIISFDVSEEYNLR